MAIFWLVEGQAEVVWPGLAERPEGTVSLQDTLIFGSSQRRNWQDAGTLWVSVAGLLKPLRCVSRVKFEAAVST